MRKQSFDIWDGFQESDSFSSHSASGRLDWLGYAAHSVSELEYQRMTQLLREDPTLEVELDSARQQLALLRPAKQLSDHGAVPRNLAMRTILRIASFARKTVGRPRMSPVRGSLDFGSGRGRLIDVAVALCTVALVLTIAIPAIYQSRQNAFWLSGQDHLRQWGHAQEWTHAAYPQSDQSPQAASFRPMDFGLPTGSNLVVTDWTHTSLPQQRVTNARQQGAWQSFTPSVQNRFANASQAVPSAFVPRISSPPSIPSESSVPSSAIPSETISETHSIFDDISDEPFCETTPQNYPLEAGGNRINSNLVEDYVVPSDRVYPSIDSTPYNTFGSYQVFHDGHVGTVSPLTSVSPNISSESDVSSTATPPLSFYLKQ